MLAAEIHPASFRDPAGFIFERDGKFYRQVNKVYSRQYEMLMSSGLYTSLTEQQLLLPHTENRTVIAGPDSWYKTLDPVQLKHISYPYEWCQEQLKDAALLTLSVMRTSLSFGMILKDATPFNIQFVNGKPVFIDTLSFDIYDENKPWVAYRQFCNTFLFPLYLAHYLKADIQKMMIVYPDGIPVDITARMLPLRSNLSVGVWLHVYMQNTVSRNDRARQPEGFNRKKLLNIVEHLAGIIAKMNNAHGNSQWSDYYESTIMGKEYLAEKEKRFRDVIKNFNPGSVLDLGCNDGYFSLILADEGFDVIAADADSRTISKLYNRVKQAAIKNILPLVVDLANPSPAIGFNNTERSSFHERIKTPLVVALALIHHLAIGRNIPFEAIAPYLAGISEHLILEWVPKEDAKVQQMLASRDDIFSFYNQQTFEAIFSGHFHIVEKNYIAGTQRVIYLMKKR